MTQHINQERSELAGPAPKPPPPRPKPGLPPGPCKLQKLHLAQIGKEKNDKPTSLKEEFQKPHK